MEAACRQDRKQSEGPHAAEERGEALNRFLVEVFQEILKTEEACLARERPDLSLRELHLIEEICRAVDLGRDNRATAIAAARRVTAGTLTVSVNLLVKKGYLERRKDPGDGRVVRLFPTQRAREANEAHARFHRAMVEEILTVLSEREASSFARGLQAVAAFFHAKLNDTEENQP